MPLPRDPQEYFLHPSQVNHRRYEALRAYFLDHRSTEEVARQFGFVPGSIRVLATLFRQGKIGEFFRSPAPTKRGGALYDLPLKEAILDLRAQRLSVYDIARRLRRLRRPVSHNTVWMVLKEAGVERLPKRTHRQRELPPKIPLPVADKEEVSLAPGRLVPCRAPLLFLFAPYFERIRFDALVRSARYRDTPRIEATSYLRSLLALKLLSLSRRNHVMPLADDPGLGLWASLNVLPKTTALSDWAYLLGPTPHRALLRGVVRTRAELEGYPTRSFNLDFHPIRHYGDSSVSHLEKDFVTRRGQSVNVVVSAFGQELASREMVYAQANVLKAEKPEQVLEFVRFWREVRGEVPEELAFDAHMTTHEVLAELDRQQVTFLTVRERRPKEVARVLAVPSERWQSVELEIEDRLYRTPRVLDEEVEVSGYPGTIRQIAAMDYGKEKPTFLLTNDRRRKPGTLLTRYARRTLIENSLGEQVHFFHVDALSSSVRIKVDLDVVLSVVASGAYRWVARQLRGFETATANTIWSQLLDRRGTVELTEDEVVVRVRRFSRAPVLLESKLSRDPTPISWLGGRRIRLEVTRGEPQLAG